MKELIEFIKENFDKLLLTTLFITLLILVLHMSHDKVDSDAINWARELSGTIIGALLGLITGGLLKKNL